MSRYVQKTRKAMDYLPVAEVYNPEPESESLNEVDIMACLNHGERAIISYLYINKLTVDQVAQILDIAPTQVRRYQQRAVEKLRQCRLK